MPGARRISALVGALFVGCIIASPAWGADVCGKPGYSYAGLVASRPVHGIIASISAPVTPTVESGDVGAWIGVGRTRVAGKRGSIRAGILSVAGSSPQLFFERRFRTGEWRRFLGPQVAPGEVHRISIRELPWRRGVWRVRIDGQLVSGKIRLSPKWRGRYALATAESWDGGTPACNQFAFHFGPLRVKQVGPWHRPKVRRAIQDPGYAVQRQPSSAFLAHNKIEGSFAGDWETGDASQWTGNHWNQSVPLSDQFRVVTDPVRQGKFAAKFTVRPGDRFASTSGERSEVCVVGADDETEGDDYWYAWSTLFPTDWTTPAGWSIFVQWHARFPTPPPVAFNVKDDRLLVYTNTGELNSNGTGTNKVAYQFADTLRRGEWNDFVVHIVWSTTNGSITVWHRAGSDSFAKQLEVTGIPTLQSRDGVLSANYLKLGLYRNEESDTDVLYQDGFQRAKAPADLQPAFGDDPGFADLLPQLSS